MDKTNPDLPNGFDETYFEERIMKYVEAQRRQARHGSDETQRLLDKWIQEEKPELEQYAEQYGLNFKEEFGRVAGTFRG